MPPMTAVKSAGYGFELSWVGGVTPSFWILENLVYDLKSYETDTGDAVNRDPDDGLWLQEERHGLPAR